MTEYGPLEATFRIVTPVFCAGADRNGPSEIRPFSIRGALRWWYRALDKNFRAWEPLIFGSTAGSGHSSPIALQVVRWTKDEADLKKDLQPQQAATSGAAYLGYTLYLKGNQRKAICPGVPDVTVRLRWQWAPKEAKEREIVQRAWLATLWLFGHLGGLGTRSRRGYGTLALQQWSGWPGCDQLQPAHGASTPLEWVARFKKGWQCIREWFPEPCTGAKHLHLGKDLKVWLWQQGYQGWKQALDEIGARMHEFRSRKEIHKPEYLAAFGLPIGFKPQKVNTFTPRGEYSRAASSLQIRVVAINGRFHPLLWRAQGPLLPEMENAEIENKERKVKKLPKPWDEPLEKFLLEIQPKCVP